MLALIIITGVFLYIVMAIVVFHLWVAFIKSQCHSCKNPYRCRTDHEIGGLWMAGLWPVLPALMAVLYILYRVASTISHKAESVAKGMFSKEDK